MKLSTLLSGAELQNAPALNFVDVEISGICPDSRRVSAGVLFIALEGENIDGSLFLADAVENGAVAALVSKRAFEEGMTDPEKYQIPLILSDDTRADMAYLFSSFYGHPQRKMKLIGVTGTNGKTSVTTLIHAILSRSGKNADLSALSVAFRLREGSTSDLPTKTQI